MNRSTNPIAVGVVLCAAAMLLLGASIPVTGLLGEYPVLMGQAIRYAAAAVLLILMAPRLGAVWVRPTLRELLLLIALAAVGMALFNVLLIAALDRAGAGLVGSVVGASPVALALAAPLVRRQSPHPATVGGAVVVTVGVGIAHGGGNGALIGVLLAGAVMLCEVGFTLLAAPLLPRLGPILVPTYACALAAPMLAMAAVVHPGRDLVSADPSQLFALLWLAVILTAVTFVLWYTGVTRLGADRAGLFAGCVPTGALATSMLLGDGVGSTAIVGAALAAVGIAVGMVRRPAGTVRPRALIPRRAESIRRRMRPATVQRHATSSTGPVHTGADVVDKVHQSCG